MSDTEERPDKSEAITVTQIPKSTSDTVIRYSKDVLLSLHDSPLVCKPENMPPLSSWFGEEAGSPAIAKNILNSSVVSRSTDKSIILGPSKTNFASSLYGGLKNTTDSKDNATSSTTKLSGTSRLRQSEDSIRTHSNNSNNRTPRGPSYIGEKGFHYHHPNNRQDKGSGGLERRSSSSYGNQSPHNNKRYHNNNHHHHNNNTHHHHSDHQGNERQTMNSSAGGRREYNREQRANNRLSHTNYNEGHDRGHEHMPEWMDYNPDTKAAIDPSDKPNANGDYMNDLEAWKSSMKKKEGLDDSVEKQPRKEDSLPQEKTNENTSLDKILDLGSLNLNQSSSTMDKIASPLPPLLDPSSTSPSSELPTKRGSRFAKFFAKREEATQQAPPPSLSSPLASVGNTPKDAAQPRSISVNELFQKPDASSQRQPTTGLYPDSIHSSTDISPTSVRMLSEEDVLQSLGAKKAAVTNAEVSPPESNANAIGFNKVLQILSQPKPAVPTSSSPSPVTDINSSPKIDRPQIHGKKLPQDVAKTETSSTTSSPVAAQQQPYSSSGSGSPSMMSRESPIAETAAAKHKKVNNFFGNNLPTSVLRKMSARSDGRSPSLSSNKSGHSGLFSHSTSDSRNGSPLIGNAMSPTSLSMSSTQQQQQHYQQSAHSPSNSHRYHGYSFDTTTVNTTTMNGSGSQSPHNMTHSIASSRVNEMMMTNPHHASRNQIPTNGYDTMMQQQQQRHMYGNGEATGMPPPHRLLPPTIHPSGSSSMNGPMNRMISPQFLQQQQQQQQPLGSAMDPAFVSRPPPPPHQMMGIPGMMAPPHLAMRPQGQASNTGNGVLPPPPFMQPMMPGMPPPPPPPMGMPQQMCANKNHGWNRQ